MATSRQTFDSVDKLFENSSEQSFEASEILLRFANNIINNPTVLKYRRIRVGNQIISSKLLPVYGAVECLFDMGFAEDGDHFTLAEEAPLDTLIEMRNEIVRRRKSQQHEVKTEQRLSPEGASHKSQGAQGRAVTEKTQKDEVQWKKPVYPADILRREADFVRKVVNSFEHVMVYEDPNLQEKARSVIPVAALKASAARRLKEVQDERGSVGIEDLLLLELLAWFKKTFFSWVNSPKCETCRGETRAVGMAEPAPEELLWGAGRVENYQCNVCQRYTRFPRYNHPGKLLETRRGRCGEWANCFTLCCRAVGLEARYTLDWTDHVWTEVYSSSEKRWLHCDPCENTCDKPLVYEHGWGKKLSYVIAFSKDEVQDVTWRYSSKHAQVLQRRTDCREETLLKTLERLCKQRQRAFTENRKNELLDRLVVELVEFLTVKEASDGESGGRVSGSKAWRKARGESGSSGQVKKSVVIRPTAEEIEQRTLHVRYSCAGDQYDRPKAQCLVSQGWSSLVFEYKNVMRKEELDWEMAYLARTEGSDCASVTWKFDLSEQDAVIDTIEVLCGSKCFEDGHISWRMCAGDLCVPVHAGEEKMVVSSLSGEAVLSLTADLKRGKGDNAWQHTQLFRQSLDSTNQYPFDIKIYMKKNTKS